jgi:uncharacterized protein YprB with RNaseH-like and TPR domain
MAQLKDSWWIITWSAKWVDSNEVMSGAVTPKEAKKKDDKRIVTELWELFNEADILIAHNAKKFDIKRSNTRFFLNGLTPPTPYQVIDTLLVARQMFELPFNRLDYLCQVLGIEMKHKTDYSLWTACVEGDEKALKYMQEYNNNDVFILEEVYYRLRPWIKNHPNLNLYQDKEGVCSTCGADNKYMKLNGKYPTNTNLFDAYQCQKCFSYSRMDKSGKKISMRGLAK